MEGVVGPCSAPARLGLPSEDPASLGAEGGMAVRLWSSDAPRQVPLRFDGSLAPLALDGLELFARAHTQPIVQNYSWELKDRLDKVNLSLAVLWANYTDADSANVTQAALRAFTSLCERRRGARADHDVLCVVYDQSYAYYQREYGSHDPYPYPFFGVTTKLGFGDGDRFGYPFKEPVNKTVQTFFSRRKKAVRQMSSWVGRVLSGRVPASHESGPVPTESGWTPGRVQEIVWKTYQREVNGSTADVLLELYDDQRKKGHLSDAALRVVATTLKDYASLKVARMEVSANHVPPVFGRKAFSKDTEYYWVPPSLISGEWTPQLPVRLDSTGEVSPERLLRFLKKHSLSSWSLKEAIETASDISDEIMGQARTVQREDDRADEEKQEMIKKMMTTLKKEKGLVDVGEMMGLKKAADAVGVESELDPAQTKMKGKGRTVPAATKADVSGTSAGTVVDQEGRREKRRQQLQKEDDKLKRLERKEKDKRRKRREAEKERKALKKQQEAEAQAIQAKERERKRKKLQEERALKPTTAYFAWGQAKDWIRISVSVPELQPDTLNVSIVDDAIVVAARDSRNRSVSLGFELREFVVPSNSSWSLRYSEGNPLNPRPDGVVLSLQKQIAHRWDRLAQNNSAIKPFMRKDWVQMDDGDLEEEKEDIELPVGPNVKKVTAKKLHQLVVDHPMVVAAIRYPWCDKCVEKDKHYAKAARTSKDKDHLGTIAFTVIDAREEKHVARTHNTTCSDECELQIFKQDEPEEPYTVPGRKFPEEVHIDCYKHLLPVVSIVPDKATLDRVTSAFDTAIIGFFSGADKQQDPWYLSASAYPTAVARGASRGPVAHPGSAWNAQNKPGILTNTMAQVCIEDGRVA
ncbi:unnamed protein product [Prorocentrum cordatum]|uniref:CS domain-containing protein n=1 Tax=Prorocentrum cordatum TaxID=2364126 RepID=A0ABN9RKC0_9DINO|nr:unnamed protein product [Polarella glacialis]